MKVYETDDFQIERASAVSLGNFDGVHLGHQELIKTVKEFRKCNFFILSSSRRVFWQKRRISYYALFR